MEGDFTVTGKKREEIAKEVETLTRVKNSELMNTHSKEEDSTSEDNGKVSLKLGVGWKVVSI